MGFHIRFRKHLQEPNSVDRSSGTGDPYNQSLHFFSFRLNRLSIGASRFLISSGTSTFSNPSFLGRVASIPIFVVKNPSFEEGSIGCPLTSGMTIRFRSP